MIGTPIIILGGKKRSGKSTVAALLEKTYGATVLSLAAPMKRFAANVGLPVANLWGSIEQKEALLSPANVLHVPNSQVVHVACETLCVELGVQGMDVFHSIAKWYERLCEGVLHHGETITCRHFLQQLGTECGREIDPDFWVRTGLKYSSRLLKGGWSYSQLDGMKAANNLTPARLIVIDDGRFPNELLEVKNAGGRSVLVHRADVPSTDQHASETSLDLIPSFWWDEHLWNNESVEMLDVKLKWVMRSIGVDPK